jgi:hypothetical protein
VQRLAGGLLPLEETGIRLSRPPSAYQRARVYEWLMAMHEDLNLDQVQQHLKSTATSTTCTCGPSPQTCPLSAHVVVDESCFHDGHVPQMLDQLQDCVAGHFDVEHSTFQLEAAIHASHEPGTH